MGNAEQPHEAETYRPEVQEDISAEFAPADRVSRTLHDLQWIQFNWVFCRAATVSAGRLIYGYIRMGWQIFLRLHLRPARGMSGFSGELRCSESMVTNFTASVNLTGQEWNLRLMTTLSSGTGKPTRLSILSNCSR
jgi:hypothetical protein